MRKYKHTKYKINPPSDVPEEFDHDCQKEECYKWTYTPYDGGYDIKLCPFMVQQYCLICGEKSFVAYSVDLEYKDGVTCMPFWVCDDHFRDEKLDKILKDGIPFKEGKTNRRAASFVKKVLENDIIST
jgi:hypothetical protein